MASVVREMELSKQRLLEIADIAYQWVFYHGLVCKDDQHNPAVADDNRICCIPFSLFPSLVPASVLDEAKSITIEFNRLMQRVANDHEFLSQCLRSVFEVDPYTSKLWSIYLKVREAGNRQPLMLGLNRNEFFMECQKEIQDGHLPRAADIRLRHAQFHTSLGCNGGFAQRLADLHKLMLSLSGKTYTTTEAPENKPAVGLAKGLIRAWELYGNSESVIVFIVDRKETSTPLSQRWLEFSVYDLNPTIRVLRKTLFDFHEYGSVRGDESRLFIDGEEVAVVYIQDGYGDGQLVSDEEWNGRLVIELSSAIKCPSVQYQLAGSPKVLQALSGPGVLEEFVTSDCLTDKLRVTFPRFSSVDLGPKGDENLEMAIASPENFIIRLPLGDSRGTIVCPGEIRQFLKEHRHSKLRNAISLVHRESPWKQRNFLMRHDIPFGAADVVNELGIFGVYIGSADTEIDNYGCGYVIKTRRADFKDGEVLDTPFLYQ